MLLKNSITYILSSATTKVGSLILIPLYIKYLSVEEFGQFYFYLLLVNVMGAIGNLGVLNSLEIFLNKKEVNKYAFFTSTMYITLIGTFFLAIFFLIIGLILEKEIIFLFSFLFLFVARTFYTLFQRFNSSILDATKFFKNDFFFTIVNSVASIFVLIYCDNKLVLLFLAQSFSLLVILFGELIKNYKHFIIPKIDLIIDIIVYSIPLLGHSLLNLLPSILDKLIIKFFIGEKSLGFYSMSLQIGEIQNILTTAFNKSFAPIFHQRSYSLDLNKIVIYTCYFFLFIAFFGNIFLSDVLNLIIGDKYLDSYDLIPVVVSAFTLNLWYYFNSTFILRHSNISLGNKLIFKISLENTIVTILVLLIIVPTFGIKGAVYCFLFSKILLSYKVTKNSNIILNNNKKFIFFLFHTITFLLISIYAQNYTLFYKFIIVTLVIVYMFFLIKIFQKES